MHRVSVSRRKSYIVCHSARRETRCIASLHEKFVFKNKDKSLNFLIFLYFKPITKRGSKTDGDDHLRTGEVKKIEKVKKVRKVAANLDFRL